MPKIERYIKVYEWLLKQKDLTTLDAILISKIMLWPSGLWLSSDKLGKSIGIHQRTVQKKIIALQKKGWLAILPELCSNRRYVWATLKEPPTGPLFEYSEKAEIGMKKQRARNAQFMIHGIAKQLSLW